MCAQIDVFDEILEMFVNLRLHMHVCWRPPVTERQVLTSIFSFSLSVTMSFNCLSALSHVLARLICIVYVDFFTRSARPPFTVNLDRLDWCAHF